MGGGQMACDVDPNMALRASTRAEWYGAPPQMFCGPKSSIPKAPRWNVQPWCNPADDNKFPLDVDLDVLCLCQQSLDN